MTQPIPIGVCIYCGKTDVKLTDEHIVPKGFGNTMGDILYEASCKECAAITSGFELVMLRENLQPIRTTLQLYSRSGKKDTIPQRVRYHDGHEAEIDVPHDKYLSVIGLPVFEHPFVLQKVFDAGLLTITEMQTFNIGKIQNKTWYELQGIEEFHTYLLKSNKGQAFAKFVMKMSYCAAVKYYGYDRVKGSVVPLIILGKNPNIATWFGNMGGADTFPDPPESNSLVRYAVGEMDGRLIVSFQFFPIFSDSPIYHTII